MPTKLRSGISKQCQQLKSVSLPGSTTLNWQQVACLSSDLHIIIGEFYLVCSHSSAHVPDVDLHVRAHFPPRFRATGWEILQSPLHSSHWGNGFKSERALLLGVLSFRSFLRRPPQIAFHFYKFRCILLLLLDLLLFKFKLKTKRDQF